MKIKIFFNDFLEFFYEGLNNQNKDDYLENIKSKVPYVGGGLLNIMKAMIEKEI